MSDPVARSIAASTRYAFIIAGIALTLAGLAGHIFAAKAIGGTHLAYRDHLFGFVIIAVVSGIIIALLGRFFRTRRGDVSVLIFGVVQALMGAFVYVQRFSVHG
jgi:predicted neutral ceramidase superfamily lipid hydrolase